MRLRKSTAAAPLLAAALLLAGCTATAAEQAAAPAAAPAVHEKHWGYGTTGLHLVNNGHTIQGRRVRLTVPLWRR